MANVKRMKILNADSSRIVTYLKTFNLPECTEVN